MDQRVQTKPDELIAGIDHSLPALKSLFDHLNQVSIRYCHWKSNLRLREALNGKTDLDLLVAREDSQYFRQILLEHNIKLVLAPPGWSYLGVENYLGFDAPSGKLFHLHVHYQLILGEQYVKNYRLPVENQVLNSVIFDGFVKIPTPEVELIILSLRALLKYRDRDVIKDIFSIRSPGIPTHILKEIIHLLNMVSMEQVKQVLDTELVLLPKESILEFLSTVESEPRDGSKFFILRRKIRQSLRDLQRNNRAKATLIYFRELWRRRNSPLPSKTKGKMTLANGGAAFALIGVDGAGKTTLHQNLFAWLNWKMDVRGFYMGSKQPSRLSDFLYWVFRIFRRGHRSVSTRFGSAFLVAQWLEFIKRNLLFAHYVAIGRDRYKRNLTGTSLARQGSLVIYDRFPLEQMNAGTDSWLMDGPQSLNSGEKTEGAVSRFLITQEFRYYDKMLLPDCFFVLDVDPEASIQRKPDHNKAVLTAKNRVIRNLISDVKDRGQFGLTPIIHVDANLPFEEVLQQLKSVMWKQL